jgi:hypothetical protein
MQYESPKIVDFGSILENTFARSGITGTNPETGKLCWTFSNKQGDFRVCELDKFCEYSCPSSFAGS